VLIATESPKFVWYLMRGSGFVALMLFTLTMALGVVGVTRFHSPRWPRLVTGELHRNVALTAMCFLALHVLTALTDSWVGLGWIGALVPFHSRYRPVWLAFGVLAFDLFLAILTSSLLRRRIGQRLWRLVHWGTWLVWPLALVHALGSGTDTTAGWGLAIPLACIATVLTALLWRIRFALRPPASRQGRTANLAAGPLAVTGAAHEGAEPARVTGGT
jgi:methionine sulfoxide reductase heme-binding subunit